MMDWTGRKGLDLSEDYDFIRSFEMLKDSFVRLLTL